MTHYLFERNLSATDGLYLMKGNTVLLFGQVLVRNCYIIHGVKEGRCVCVLWG
jgi:hypothetical protein